MIDDTYELSDDERQCLFDDMFKIWSGMTEDEYKHFKNIAPDADLLDAFTHEEFAIYNVELDFFYMLRNTTKPQTFNEYAKIAHNSGIIALNALKTFEHLTGTKVVSPKNENE